MNQPVAAVPRTNALDALFEEVDRLEGNTARLTSRLERVSRITGSEAQANSTGPGHVNDIDRLINRVREVSAQLDAATNRLDI